MVRFVISLIWPHSATGEEIERHQLYMIANLIFWFYIHFVLGQEKILCFSANILETKQKG